ncbi:MAG: GH1 family beta-glucosidase [Candidatus Ornithospirochaeta sp.]
MAKKPLPEDFLIGSATAAYQVEGAGTEDGRTECIWDEFSRIPGKVWCGENGSVAADQYHRMKEDVALMASLGLKAYRFSVSWTRVLPNGGRIVNEKGVEYYRNLCLELHKYGIKACCTLYHWDLPVEMERKGGWAERSTAYDFQYFAEVMFRELGDLVDMWFTINEPFCICLLGYLTGVHAPGVTDSAAFARSVHYTNLAHGLAVESYRKTGLKAPIGIVWNPIMPRSATDRKEDKEAALASRAINSEIYIGPVVGKGYPRIATEDFGLQFPIEEGDMETISTPIDFYGINYYNERVVAYDKNAPFHFSEKENWEEVTTGMGWPIVEKGLNRILKWLDEYTGHLPVYITENGSAEDDRMAEDGRIHDRKRIEYISKHLGAVADAISEGIDVRGYFYWSFIDNYEWSNGYTKRFGMVWCDYMTLKRIPKDSAYYIRDVAAGYGY